MWSRFVGALSYNVMCHAGWTFLYSTMSALEGMLCWSFRVVFQACCSATLCGTGNKPALTSSPLLCATVMYLMVPQPESLGLCSVCLCFQPVPLRR
jgi:hypothetical protein